MPETCCAIASWDGQFLHCTFPAGHKTLLEHFDGDRALRWLQDGRSGRVTAWPGTGADTRAFVARVDESFRCLAGDPHAHDGT